MRDTCVKGAGGEFAGIFEGHLRRHRQVITYQHHRECDEKSKPIRLAKERRRGRNGLGQFGGRRGWPRRYLGRRIFRFIVSHCYLLPFWRERERILEVKLMPIVHSKVSSLPPKGSVPLAIETLPLGGRARFRR